jgi:branched-chain amino acid transport system substrate-binding protein
MMQLSFFHAAGVSVLLALTPHITQAAGSTPPPLRIGLIAPLTGGSADFGNSMRMGAQLAVQDINEVGGFQGRLLELVIRDDESKPDIGREAAENLVNVEKVSYTIGFCNTGVATKSLEVFQKNQHILMVPCSTGTPVISTYPAQESFIFRLAQSDTMAAKFFAAEIAGRRKLTKIAILADNTGYGSGGLNDITAELAKMSLQPIHVGRFDAGVTDLSDAMRAAKKSGAQALLVYTVGPEQAVAVKARQALGWKVPYFAPWPLSFRHVLERAGAQALEGTMMAQTIIQDFTNERKTSFISRYIPFSKEKKIGSLMAAAQSYDAVNLMLRAVFQTRGDVSGPALKNALENLQQSHQGVVTTYKKPYSIQDHESFSAKMIWLGVWRKGNIEFFYPDEAKLSAQVRYK